MERCVIDTRIPGRATRIPGRATRIPGRATRIPGLDPGPSCYWRLRTKDPGSALRLAGISEVVAVRYQHT